MNKFLHRYLTLLLVFFYQSAFGTSDNQQLVDRIHYSLHGENYQLAIDLLNDLRKENGFELTFPDNSLFRIYIETCLQSNNYSIDDSEGELYLNAFSAVYGAQSQKYVTALKEAAYYYYDIDRFEFAIPLLLDFQKLYSKGQIVSQRIYYDALLSLGWCYYYTMKRQQAYLAFSQCADFFSNRYGETNSSYTVALRGMAVCEDALNRDNIDVLLRENEILEKRPGIESIPYAINLDNIGVSYYRKNDYINAIDYSNRALIIFEKLIEERHSAIACSNIAISLIKLGKYEEAEFYVEKGLGFRPDNQGLLACRAEIELAKGNPRRALELVKAYDDYEGFKSRCCLEIGDTLSFWEYQSAFLKSKRDKILSNVFLMTENERRDMLSSFRDDGFTTMFKVASNNHCFKSEDICFNNLLLSKSILLSFNTTIWESIESTKDSQLRFDFYKWRILKGENKLTEKELEMLERQIISRIDNYTNYSTILGLTSEDIKKELNNNEIAVEFYCSDKDIFATTISHDSHEQVIKLCSIAELSGILHKGLDEAILNGTLYDTIWSPIFINSIPKKVFFSTDGLLHQLPIEWLIESTGEPAFESIDFIRLSSTREIVLNKRNSNNKKNGINSVLFGGLKYNDDAPNSNNGIRSVLGHSSYEYLPATLAEVNNIYLLLSKRKDTKVKEFTNYQGTESAFRQLSGTGVTHFHIATHGFFYSSLKTNRINSSLYKKNAEANALELSGLVLSKAGISKDNAPSDNGLLTAQEISIMDFSNVQLVVLSACKTGLGEIGTDGVFGLQRGFKQAKCQSIVMSLWNVDDGITQKLMNYFYVNWDGKNSASALKTAVIKTRISHKNEPYFWASFISLDSLN